MRIMTPSLVILIGAGLTSGQAAAANFGSVTLQAGEARVVDLSTSARTMRVCNDFFSSGRAAVTIGTNTPHDLSPGVCAEDIGDRMAVQSLAAGIATIEYWPLSDVRGSRMFEE